MYNPVDGMVTVVNNTFETKRDMFLVVKTYDMKGNEKLYTQIIEEVLGSSVKGFFQIKNEINKLAKEEGVFLSLQLLDIHKNVLSENLYWLPDEHGAFSGLKKMAPSRLEIVAKQISPGHIEVTLTNPTDAPVAFFNRLSLIDPQTNDRLLPVFYSNNYVSVLPGEHKSILMDFDPILNQKLPALRISGWNFKEQTYRIEK